MLLELHHIKKQFAVKKGFLGAGKEMVTAVDNVSLAISPGENVSLVGESGCGKTTLARLVMKLYPVTDGQIKFLGNDITRMPNKAFHLLRKDIQMVFQDPYNSLDPRMSVRHILKEGFELDTGKFSTDAAKEKRMCELLEAVDLKQEMLNRYPHEFSGGERQRIAIARALVLNPKLLILDEAVSALDVIIQEQIVDLLADLQAKFHLTYFFISHNLKIVRKLSRRIAVMYRGKIVEIAETEDLFNNPVHPYTKALLKAAIEYKPYSETECWELPPHAVMAEISPGHFVIKK